MVKKYLALLSIVCAGLAVAPPAAVGQDILHAQTTKAIQLDDIIEEALSANSLLEAYRLQAEGFAQRAAQVSALPDPFAMVRVQPFPIFTARGFQRSQWSLSQYIPFPGKLKLKGAIAAHSADQVRHEADVIALDLVLEVKRAYYELYLVQEQQRLIQSFQDQLSGFEDIATVRYEVGDGPQQAVLQAQLEWHSFSQSLLALAQRRRASAEDLARTINRPGAAELFETSVVAPPEDALFDVSEALTRALEERPEVRALQSALERSDETINLAQKAFLPDFTVSVNYFDIARSNLTPTMTGRDAVGIGFEINIPLWRRKLRASLEESRIERREAQARFDYVQTEITTAIHDLAAQLDIERRALALYEETLIPQAEITLEATLSAYTTGETDFLNLLDAERQLFALRMKEVESAVRILTLHAALERAAGIAPQAQ